MGVQVSTCGILQKVMCPIQLEDPAVGGGVREDPALLWEKGGGWSTGRSASLATLIEKSYAR